MQTLNHRTSLGAGTKNVVKMILVMKPKQNKRKACSILSSSFPARPANCNPVAMLERKRKGKRLPVMCVTSLPLSGREAKQTHTHTKKKKEKGREVTTSKNRERQAEARGTKSVKTSN